MAALIAGAGLAQTTSDAAATKETVTSHAVAHHYRHVTHRRVVHAAAVTPAERVQTDSLNREQLYSAQNGSEPRNLQNPAAYYPQQPGQNAGVTPVRRIPNGVAFQAATPTGGRADPSTLEQVHSR
jgi:hypothetical protein